MAFVNYKQEILREKVEQTVGALSGFTAVKIPGIVLDAATMSKLFDHLNVIFYTLFNSLSLSGIAQFVKEFNLLHQIVLYVSDGNLSLFFGSDKKIGRINLIFFKTGHPMEGHGIQFLDAVNLIVPPGDTQYIIRIGHEYIHRIAFHTEVAAFQFDVIPDVQGIHELAQELVAFQFLALLQRNHTGCHCRRTSHAIDARDAAYHHHVLPSGKQ